MDFLMMVIVTIIEVLVVCRIRFVYSRQPYWAISWASVTILLFYLVAKLSSSKYVGAFAFSLATLNLILLVVMLLYMWILNQTLKQQKALQGTDFLMVLGSKCLTPRVTPVLASRLDKAIELFNNFDVKPQLIVTGGRSSVDLPTEAELMKQYLVDAGIPAEMIIMETKAKNTIQNLGFSSIKIRNIWHKDIRPRVIIVTSDYHLPRTKFHAKKLGLKVNFAAARTVKMLKWPAMFREFTAILWDHRYSLVTIWGMDVLFSLSMCI